MMIRLWKCIQARHTISPAFKLDIEQLELLLRPFDVFFCCTGAQRYDAIDAMKCIFTNTGNLSCCLSPLNGDDDVVIDRNLI